jgi:hypothetical protein
VRYDEFLGHVQHRARLGSRGEAERATRATLETLAERLVGGEAHDLASQLPPELARSLQSPDAGIGAKLTLEEFFELVSEREVSSWKRRHCMPGVVMGSSRKPVPWGIKDVRVQLGRFRSALNVNEATCPRSRAWSEQREAVGRQGQRKDCSGHTIRARRLMMPARFLLTDPALCSPVAPAR